LFVTQLDQNGNLAWTRSDSVVNPFSAGLAVTAVGSTVYVAGNNADSGQTRAYLRSFDDQGNVGFTQTSVIGTLAALVYDSATNSLYAAGNAGGATEDFLIQRWDLAGNLIWSRTFDRSGGQDRLTGVAIAGGVYTAVGWTTGNTAGGQDGVVLEFDPTNGDLLVTTLWGGSGTDLFTGAAFRGDTLHVSGSTTSFGAGGTDAAYVLYQAAVPEPGTLALLGAASVGFGLNLWRRRKAQQTA
jgi:hypothetical protein